AGAPGFMPIGEGSFSLRTHPQVSGWRGVVAYNDNHTAVATRPDPESLSFTFSGLPQDHRKQFDNLFVNENDVTRLPDDETLAGDAGKNTNNFLRLWSVGRQGERKAFNSFARPGPLSAITPWYD